FVIREGDNQHLDTLEGRYWLQLEWRALTRALASSGPERRRAASDALAFRLARRTHFKDSADNENRLEMNEGLAQYTGTAAAASSQAEAVADAIDQLKKVTENETFIRTFAYPSGAAYGLLLDAWSPGWTRKVKSSDDFGKLLMAAAKIE